jgi:short-subunit dehydrogenase
MRIRDAAVLVTGASSGLGRAAAEQLAAAGALVIAHGRETAALAEVAASTGGTALPADLSVPGEAQRLAEAALAVHGRLDIVVNNAGQGWAGPFTGMPAADLERLIAVNLSAPVALTRAVLPAMLGAGTGYLAFVGSIAGRTGVAGESVYAATKAGLDTFAESLRFELRRTGIGVGVLVPGVVDTAFFERRGRGYQRRSPRPRPAGEVAAALVRMIAGDRAEAYAPRWLRLPVAVRGALPGTYRGLAGRFGGG